MSNSNLLIPKAGTVVLRLYNVGLGDCFLLAIPDGKKVFYLVIDCGIAKGTPNEKQRMEAVVADIVAATGGNIDVLVVTHEHYDHVCGFYHQKEVWQSKLKVKQVWISWIEKDGETEAGDVRAIKAQMNAAARDLVARSLANAAPDQGGPLRAENGFLGVDPGVLGVSVMDDAYKIAKGLGPNVYCEPGEVRSLDTTGVQAFVLGPPRHKGPDGKDLVKDGKPLLRLLEDPTEMYGYADIGQVPDGKPAKKTSFALGADEHLGSEEDRQSIIQALRTTMDRDDSEDFERYCPFDSRYRIAWDVGMTEPFFEDNYSATAPWRRIDGEWMGSGSGSELALRAGQFTNNISLVLAFRLPNSGRVLLFPGDAQVGNCLSWHHINDWIPVDKANSPAGYTVQKLLNDVAFYKVGHHGSHNATLKDKGLEMMGQRGDLVAYVPVSVPVAHDIMGYCPMPFYPVMTKLVEKTSQRVLLGTGQWLNNATPELPGWLTKTSADQTLEAKVYGGEKIENEVPIYVELTIDDSEPAKG